MSSTRVTVTLPSDIVENIDRLEPNRSAFLLEAVKRELRRRARRTLRRSLLAPHAESRELAETGLDDWAKRLPAEDAALVDPRGGTRVRWTSKGWVARK